MARFWRDADRSAVTVQEAVGEWALAAWDVLEYAAARWRRTVTTEALGAEVQKRSGIVTDVPTSAWVAPVLALVAQRAHESRGPALTALVTEPDGGVPDSYREVLRLEGRPLDDPAEHARAARMACHRAYEARIPAGVDELPGPRPRRTAAAAPARTAPKPRVCPHCHLQLPATGVCDDCD